MELDFLTIDERYNKYEDVFNDLAAFVIEKLAVKAELIISVSLIDNEQIHQINRDYRQIDRPTDVISFAFLDGLNREKILKSKEPIALGDIYISIEKANEQAIEYNHSLDREMCFLFVHGLLHLLGYDHQTAEEETKMFALQDEILKEKGFTR